jgi:hypothetical protein
MGVLENIGAKFKSIGGHRVLAVPEGIFDRALVCYIELLPLSVMPLKH